VLKLLWEECSLMRFLLLFILSTLLSCKTTEVPTQVEVKPVAVIFSELNSGTNGDFPEKTNKVITDQNTYNEIWGKAFANFSNQQRPAKIDFENKMIVLVASGMQRSGGHKIKIKSVEEIKSAIVVNVENSKPGESCMTTSIITFPYQIIELKKSTKLVTFKTDEKVYECEK
jgi:hypothetical protein